jgi:hypothetical protein
MKADQIAQSVSDQSLKKTMSDQILLENNENRFADERESGRQTIADE